MSFANRTRDALMQCAVALFAIWWLSTSGALAKTVLEELVEQAQQGDIDAQARLGFDYYYGYTRYEDGSDPERDVVAAEYWLTLAAEQGEMGAQLSLGWLHYDREGETRNELEALRWFRAYLRQALEEEKEADKSWRIRIARGIAEVQFTLGNMFYQECGFHLISLSPCGSNRPGRLVFQDYQRAVGYFREAAERGHTQAKYELGVMYEAGRGVPQDFHEAAIWYRDAAQSGLRDAIRPLAEVHLKMDDYVSAHMWFNIASMSTRGTNRAAAERRDQIAHVLTAGQLVRAQRLATEWNNQFGR